MLYLPRGVQAWYATEAVIKNVKLGRLLVDIACSHAWRNGYRCNHEYNKHEQTHPTLPLLLVKCVTCGMRKWVFNLDKMKKETDSQKRDVCTALVSVTWHYTAVGHAEKDLLESLDNIETIS